jgi:probable HAF family extracellular repeat protein
MASNGGAVAVGYASVSVGNRPFRWTPAGGMVALGDLPGGGVNGFATGMSADGAVVSGQGSSTAGTEAFRWTAAGGMVGLGDFTGGAFNSTAWAVSADGAALAGDGTTAAGRQAFVWTAGSGMVALGHLPGGGAFSSAHGVSSGGAYAAGSSDAARASEGFVEAFRWSAGDGMVGLGDLPGGPFGSFANAISADGSVVVGGSETAAGTMAYFWTAACGMRNLRQYLLSLGVEAVASWTLQNAHGVSADGTTIVGYGSNALGQTEAWIARIDPCVVTRAGAVPDGASVPGVPLRVERDVDGALLLYWSGSCVGSDADYGVYEGTLGNFTSHVQRACTTLGATAARVVPSDFSAYYLVVPNGGSREGSYGRDGTGGERPPSTDACLPQAIASCP